MYVGVKIDRGSNKICTSSSKISDGKMGNDLSCFGADALEADVGQDDQQGTDHGEGTGERNHQPNG